MACCDRYVHMFASVNTMVFLYLLSIFVIGCPTKQHFPCYESTICTNIVAAFILDSSKKPNLSKKCLQLSVFMSELAMEEVTIVAAHVYSS